MISSSRTATSRSRSVSLILCSLATCFSAVSRGHPGVEIAPPDAREPARHVLCGVGFMSLNWRLGLAVRIIGTIATRCLLGGTFGCAV
jgi:hypothetical protein